MHIMLYGALIYLAVFVATIGPVDADPLNMQADAGVDAKPDENVSETRGYIRITSTGSVDGNQYNVPFGNSQGSSISDLASALIEDSLDVIVILFVGLSMLIAGFILSRKHYRGRYQLEGYGSV